MSRVFGICLVEISVRVEDGVPDGHEAGIVTDILGVMEDMICTVCAKGHESEDAPGKLVATVSVVCLKNSKYSPLHNSEEMQLWPKNEHANHGGVVITNRKLNWVSILA